MNRFRAKLREESSGAESKGTVRAEWALCQQVFGAMLLFQVNPQQMFHMLDVCCRLNSESKPLLSTPPKPSLRSKQCVQHS